MPPLHPRRTRIRCLHPSNSAGCDAAADEHPPAAAAAAESSAEATWAAVASAFRSSCSRNCCTLRDACTVAAPCSNAADGRAPRPRDSNRLKRRFFLRAHRGLLLLTLLALMTLACCWILGMKTAHAETQVSSDDCGVTPLPAVVRIAILVYCDAAAGALSDHPFVSCGPEQSVNSKKFITQSLQGLQMYTDLMRSQQSNLLPLPSGDNVTLQFTYINQGRVNFDNANEFETLLPSLVGPDGLWASVTNATRAEAEYGGAFTFILSSSTTPDTAQPLLMNQCEESNECIVILPFHTALDVMTCTATAPDCIRRGRLAGTRRWSNSLAVAALSLDFPSSPLELLKVQGVRTLAVIGKGAGFRGSTYVPQLVGRTSVLAAQLNIRTVFSQTMVLCGAACGPAETHVYANRTADEAAEEIVAANPDALIFLSGELPYAFATFAATMDAFKRLDWTPRALVILVGADVALPKFLADPTVIQHAIVDSLFDPRIKGPQFHNYKTASNFELLPATDEKDAPQVFTEAYLAKYPLTEGDTDFASGSASYSILDTFQALVVAQKLLEFAETAHVPSLLLAATRISAPSYLRPVEFDITGTLRLLPLAMMQLTPKQANATKENPFHYAVLTPYNVGVPPVFPLPTWKERVYAPAFYSTPAEQAIVSLTSALLLACALLLALIGVWWQHPVIAASTPLFCCLVVVGCMLLLASNFFNTLHVNDAHCRAQIALLTFGFSLTFGALLIKTYRVHTLLSSKQLAAVSLPQRDLLLAVAAILSVDALLNIAWAATVGMHSQLIVVDPVRPFYNYTQCVYGDGQLGFVYAHVAIKCTLLLCGVILAWKVRRAPSLFSESTHISLCIYNVSVVLAFLVPVLATGLGGRSALYLIRALSICFVATTTCIVLFAPKFWTISMLRSRMQLQRPEHDCDALKSDSTHSVLAEDPMALHALAHSSVLADAEPTDFQQPHRAASLLAADGAPPDALQPAPLPLSLHPSTVGGSLPARRRAHQPNPRSADLETASPAVVPRVSDPLVYTIKDRLYHPHTITRIRYTALELHPSTSNAEAKADDLSGWDSAQKIILLEKFIEYQTARRKGDAKALEAFGAQLLRVDAVYKFSSSQNAELRFRWLTLAIRR